MNLYFKNSLISIERDYSQKMMTPGTSVQHVGGYSVLWKDTISTAGDYICALEDTNSTLENVQYSEEIP